MAPELRRFHGRRLARPLTQRRKELIEHLLPRLRIQIPEAGSVDPFLLDPRALFVPSRKQVWLEIGFGGGEHLAWQAERHPDIGFVGCEPFLNGLASLLTMIDAKQLANVRLHPDDARLLLARLAPRSIDRCFILFPDPWPKARHKKRRIVSTETLDWLAGAMVDDAELRLASDDADYVEHMLDVTKAHPAFAPKRIGEESAHRPDDWPPTRYEEKARAKGAACRFLIFKRLPRNRHGSAVTGGSPICLPHTADAAISCAHIFGSDERRYAMAHSMMHSIGSAVSRFFERRRVEKTRTALLTLDDHALADIGMVRSDLEAREDPMLAHDTVNPRKPIERTH